jgi:pseudouridine synthase
MEERLQKLMAQAGIGSRRDCEKLITEGRVRVNGRVATLGDKADPSADTVEVNGRALKLKHIEFVYVALNKPKGIISSLEDELERGRKTVRDLIPLPGHLYPVGRLDKQSEGLMLMTNDGDMAHKLTHPRYEHKKTYHATLDGRIKSESLEAWRRGVLLEDGRTYPVEINILRQEATFTHLEITMHEGRKRQIRRIASMFGHPVTKLVRVKIGPIELGNLKPGEWRYLKSHEITELRQATETKRPRRRRPAKWAASKKKTVTKTRNTQSNPAPSSKAPKRKSNP